MRSAKRGEPRSCTAVACGYGSFQMDVDQINSRDIGFLRLTSDLFRSCLIMLMIDSAVIGEPCYWHQSRGCIECKLNFLHIKREFLVQ
ncbi:hypothetical protein L596_008286 [Steinernema carpocapsae]|uniref:Uncharacterized protein n=1 Tax=Steinernema carpocapsae TaxID=34508 RepID=A0A4U5PCA0_STECR|nr:hypothetical protein L596_008286 [Steinernema carpocapsae]